MAVSNRTLTLTALAVFTIVYAIGDSIMPIEGTARHWWADMCWTLISLAAAIRCFITANKVGEEDSMAWLLFGVGCFSWFIGMLIWDYLELFANEPIPFPALSDIGFLAFAPFMMAGLVVYLRSAASLVPTLKAVSELALILCATIITLILILYNPILMLREPALYKITALAYPVLYGGLFFFGLFRGLTSKDNRNIFVYSILMMALFIHAVTDTLYAYSLLGKSYDIGSHLDLYWIIGFAVIYWAAYEGLAHQGAAKIDISQKVFGRVKYLESTISGFTIAWLVTVLLIFSDVITYNMAKYIVPFIFTAAVLIIIIGWADRNIQEQLYSDLAESENKLKTANAELEKRVEERTRELEASRNEAIKASNAKSEFLSRMSHELRTPLNAVIGFSQLLHGDESLSSQQHESINYITDAGDHLLRLVNDALDLQGIEANVIEVNLENIDLLATIHECLIMVDHLAKKVNVSIINQMEGNDIHVKTDRLKLKQILINLISNAIKYNHDNGRVVITHEIRNDNTVRVLINNTGILIPEDQQQLIFDPFVRLNPAAGEGSGVGLAVTRKLVMAMNGNIGVESSSTDGTTFWVELPVA